MNTFTETELDEIQRTLTESGNYIANNAIGFLRFRVRTDYVKVELERDAIAVDLSVERINASVAIQQRDTVCAERDAARADADRRLELLKGLVDPDLSLTDWCAAIRREIASNDNGDQGGQYA